jgi:hypothetical protein
MSRKRNKIIATLATAVVATAVVPATSSAYYLERSTYDAQTEVNAAQPGSYLDVGSPDRLDASRVPSSPAPTPAAIDEPSSFDWGDAGIGAGSALGVLLIALSVMFTVVHRRNRAATT